jgi:hypothetical protein
LAIPFEATRQSATPTTWRPPTGARCAWWRRGHLRRRAWTIHLGEPTAPSTETAYGNTNGTTVSWTASAKP